MSKQADLESLEQAAIVAVAIEDRTERHKAGQWLEARCRTIDDEYRIVGGIDRESEIRIMAVLKIIFDHILHDAIEEADEDWGVVMGIDERSSEQEAAKIIKGS